MIPESLQEQAALYVCGALTAQERENFELTLEFDPAALSLVTSLAEVSTAAWLSTLSPAPFSPSAGLKNRILAQIADRPQKTSQDGFVMADAGGLVQWVNPTFSAMCGYSLEELRGKKLGPILQGQKTDLDTAERMRQAVRKFLPCRESILNYHKNGSHYWVEISIAPIFDETGKPVWLVARERELPEGIAA